MFAAREPGSRVCRRLILPALLVSASSVAMAQDGGDPAAPASPGQEAAPPVLPDALRNPRALRREQNITQGPRMVAGGVPINSETFIDFHIQLEPVAGEFTFTGRQWTRPDSEPLEFSGTWRNQWILDGLYLESSFTLADRSGTPYQVLGLTWYDDAEQQFRAQFLNSANQNQSLRWGNFDEVAATDGRTQSAEPGVAAEPPSTSDDADQGIHAEPPGQPALTLTMFGRNAGQPADSPPVSKFEIVIVSVNEFRYIGYNRPRNAEGENDWRKSFEMTMTRIEPLKLD